METLCRVGELGIAAASGDPRIIFIVAAERGIDLTGAGYFARKERARAREFDAQRRVGECPPGLAKDLSPGSK